MTDPIEEALNTAKTPQPQFTMEEALKQSQPKPPSGGFMDTASHFADFYYGQAKTEASKTLSAYSSGFQDTWGANQSQINKDYQNELKNNKHPKSGSFWTDYYNAMDTNFKNWSSIARHGLAEYGNFAESLDNAAHKSIGTFLESSVPDEATLLKLGYSPEDIHHAYSLLDKSGVAPAAKAAFHAAEKSAIPSAASLQTAEAGGALGTAVGGPIGGLIGAVGGGIAGYMGTDRAQDYLMSKLPEKHQELLGLTPKQQQEDELKHPLATFTGGLSPFAATFRPGLLPKAVPQDASKLLKALAHPLGQRAISAVLMGDWEAVQELWNEGETHSDKVAVASAIGSLFPRNEALEKIGILNDNSRSPQIHPTINEARANGLIGAEGTPEQKQNKNEAIANLPPEKTVNRQKQTVEHPLSTEEAISSRDPKDNTIAKTASEKIQAVGRPQQEADTYGNLIQHYFETRSARFNGKIGTPQELFDKEFPKIIRADKDGNLSSVKELNQYAGQVAASPEKRAALDTAVKMYGRGDKEEDIQSKTGWFRNPYDGQWRYEFSDDNSDLHPAFGELKESDLFGEQHSLPLGKVLYHPELYKNYPEAENIKVTKRPGFMDFFKSQQGSFDHESNLLNITPYADNPHSVILHEVQHWIQKQEGFAKGGNAKTVVEHLSPIKQKELLQDVHQKIGEKKEPYVQIINSLHDNETLIKEWATVKQEDDIAWKHLSTIPGDHPGREMASHDWNEKYKKTKELEDKVQNAIFGHEITSRSPEFSAFFDLRRELKKDHSFDDITAKFVKAVSEFEETQRELEAGNLKVLQSKLDSDTSHNLYRSISGEIEARDVQARQHMTDEERAKTRPYSSENIDPKDAITFYHDEDGKLAASENNELNQRGRKASITREPIEGNQRLIKLFSKSDASSILHELGHDWLESLIRDSNHQDAPPQLKADVQTVMSWYNRRRGGADKWEADQPIPEVAHERWARGFERYMMEGKAPSKELLSVFARFKAWLTKIYKTVQALKAPINDDIRGVFDRLLSETPTRSEVDSHMDYEEPATGPTEPLQGLPQESVTQIPKPEETLPGASTAPSEDLLQKEILDKDGNFRIKQITNYDDLDKGVKAWITRNANLIQARKDKLTPEDNLNFTAKLGLAPAKGAEVIAKLENLFGGPDIPVSGKVFAVGRYMDNATQNLVESLLKGDKKEILEARQTMLAAMKTFETARTDWGYTGHAFQQLYKIHETAGTMDELMQTLTGKTDKEFGQEIDRLKAEAQKRGITLEQMAKLQKAEADPKLGPMITEFYRSNMISGLLTHGGYFEYNKMWALWKLFPTTAMQALSSKAISMVNKEPIDRIHFSELIHLFYELGPAQADGLRAMADAALSGSSTGITPLRVAQDMAKYELEKGKLKQEDYDARVKYLTENQTEAMFTKSMPPKNTILQQSIPGLTGHILRAGGERIAAPMHSEAYTFMYQMKESQLIYREAVNRGYTGQALAAKVAEMKYDTPIDLIKRSREEALKATLMSGQSEIAKKLASLAATKFGKQEWQPFIIPEPFITIAGDIVSQVVRDATPLGIFNREIWHNAFGKDIDPVKRAETQGALMMGTALTGAVWYWLQSGFLNGPAGPNKKENAAHQIATGYPYSFHIGNSAINVQKMGVLGEAIATISDFLHVGQYIKKDDPWYDRYAEATWGIIHNIGHHFLGGIGPFAGFSHLYDADKNGNAVEQWGVQTAGNFEPFSIFQSQLAKQIDPYQRDIWSQNPHDASRIATEVIHQLMKQTPFLSKNLPAKIDIFGNPILNDKFKYGVYVQQLQNDPVVQYLDKHPDMMPSKVRQPRNFKLNDEEYNEYQIKAGTYLKERLDELITPEFETLDHHLQHVMIQDSVRASRQKAITELQTKNKDLLQQQLDLMNQMSNGE